MSELMFVLAFFVPPAVILLSAATLAITSIPRRRESAAPLREHHA